MDIDEYFEKLARLMHQAKNVGLAIEELVEQRDQQLVVPLLSFRERMLTSGDENWLSGYLPTGFFAGWTRRERLAAFALTFEAQREWKRIEVRSLCEPYAKSQRLFKHAPHMFDEIRKRVNGRPDQELINVLAAKSIDGSEVYRAGNGYTKLCPYLSPDIVNWAREEWPSAPTFIRLDADRYTAEQPLQRLWESAMVPASPSWLSNFSLRKGMKDFGSYQLLDRPISDGEAEYWDYHVKMVRRLEVCVERREENYLTMMIEELPRPDDSSGLMIGRCIHLDSRDPAFTPLGEVKMQHLDLAINVYEGEDRKKRFDGSLQNGRVHDATFRTHLFRIEGIPFSSLFLFSAMFLESKVLIGEWVNDLVRPEPSTDSEKA